MKIVSPKEKLLRAIQLAERLAGKKESLPVLSCILIEVEDACTIRSTNLEAGIEVKVPCEIKAKGVVAIPAAIFSQTIRSISGDTVTLSLSDSNMLVESRGTRTIIKTVPHDEFPQLGGSEKEGVSIPRAQLISGIQGVVYAASPSMIRPELGSIFVSMREESLVCVATDSFRLAEKTIASVRVSDPFDLLIPLKHATELIHVLERMETDTVGLASDDSQLTVSGDGVRFVTRIVDGNFPNYRDIIPKGEATSATLLKTDFSEMLKKARVFSGADSQVGLHIYPSKKIFSATAQNAAIGEMSDTIEAALSGEDLDINFHIGYLGDCVSSIASDSITLSFAGIGRPLVIRGVSDPSYLYLVMPLNR
jgi:DNA polymerase-3 subunit beta